MTPDLAAHTGDTMTDDGQFLGPLTLEKGAHKRGSGMCAMEAAAYLAGEKHSDHPECVSPVIAEFMRSWNDGLPDDQRHILKPWIPRVLHTRTSEADEQTRAWLATDWLVRVQAPAWLDLAELHDRATELRNLPALTSSEIAVAVQSVIEHARQDAAAAGAAAGAAACAAAWAAAWAAAEDAAEAAARAAARAAAAAAGAAARAAAGAAARAAAEAAAEAAAAAACAAARAAAGAAARAAAGAAAEAAAREKLAPTVTQLQASAFELLERMIAVGQTVESPHVLRAVESHQAHEFYEILGGVIYEMRACTGSPPEADLHRWCANLAAIWGEFPAGRAAAPVPPEPR